MDWFGSLGSRRRALAVRAEPRRLIAQCFSCLDLTLSQPRAMSFAPLRIQALKLRYAPATLFPTARRSVSGVKQQQLYQHLPR